MATDYGSGKNLQASENIHIAQVKVAADTYYDGMRLEGQKAGTAEYVGTGNGTCTAITAAPEVKSGAWTFTFTAALLGYLSDPDGNIVAYLSLVDGGAAAFNVGGLRFTITDGGTAFAATGVWTITIATAVTYVALDEGNLDAIFYGQDGEVVSAAAYRQCILGGDIAESGLKTDAGAAVTLTDEDRAAYARRGFFMVQV